MSVPRLEGDYLVSDPGSNQTDMAKGLPYWMPLFLCAKQPRRAWTSKKGSPSEIERYVTESLTVEITRVTFVELEMVTTAFLHARSQGYGYYGPGNRYVSTNSNLPSLSLETPSAASWYSTAAVPNQIAGWTYDASGNVTAVGSMSRTFTYDAENRQVTATIGSTTYNYAYDGEGSRVSVTENGQTTVLAYDAFGNLATEYGQSGLAMCGTATCYLTVDHLGSTRMLTDSAGVVQRRFDYLPFGELIPSGTNGRAPGMGYLATADQIRLKFTGQQKDGSTTGLDFFNARYLSGAQGRFTSADPGNAHLEDPQTWNGYAYVNNNPLNFTDPSGTDGGGGSSLCAAGPVLCGIGIGIDVGLAFWKIFGGGEHSTQVTIPKNGPELWNEQLPVGLNTGTVLGGCGVNGITLVQIRNSESREWAWQNRGE